MAETKAKVRFRFNRAFVDDYGTKWLEWEALSIGYLEETSPKNITIGSMYRCTAYWFWRQQDGLHVLQRAHYTVRQVDDG